MPMTSFQKYFLIILSIIALSIAYYFVRYLPQKELNKIELEKIQYLEKEKAKQDLVTCLQKSEDMRYSFWNKVCYQSGLNDDCSLPTHQAEDVRKSYESYKDDCYKAYPQ